MLKITQFKQLIAKRALLGQSFNQQIKSNFTQQSKRGFSSGAGVGFGKTLATGAIGVGAAGLAYINYMGHQARMNASPE